MVEDVERLQASCVGLGSDESGRRLGTAWDGAVQKIRSIGIGLLFRTQRPSLPTRVPPEFPRRDNNVSQR